MKKTLKKELGGKNKGYIGMEDVVPDAFRYKQRSIKS